MYGGCRDKAYHVLNIVTCLTSRMAIWCGRKQGAALSLRDEEAEAGEVLRCMVVGFTVESTE